MISGRLKQARLSRGFKTSSEFALYCDVEEGTYRHHENGTRGLTIHALRKYASVLDICVCWLLTGEDSKHSKKNKRGVKFSEVLNIKDKKALIMTEFLKLTPDEKKETLKILVGFVHK